MAESELAQILQRGSRVWNHWRKIHDNVSIDLHNTDLRGSYLPYANLGFATLSEVDLSHATLNEAVLSHAILNKAVLSYAYLSKADLLRANLSKADLCGADLRGADLCSANLSHAYLINADLRGANLYGADLSHAILRNADLFYINLSNIDLSCADLHNANLGGADLSRANLCGADLSRANLSGTNLSGANLRGADLSRANLSGTNLSGAALEETDWTNATAGLTQFDRLDLRGVIGLETVYHAGPSTISLDTIYSSHGQVSEAFLRSAGVPETFITNMRALVDSMSPIEFYSCFISYSHQNEDFAKRIYADLRQERVRCWFAKEDLKIGDHYHQRIDEAIRLYDKLILILSEHSVENSWVEREVAAAREKEERKQCEVLFPIRLDDAVMNTTKAWAADVRRRWHIGDFTKWKEHDHYQRAFERLLRDLKAEQ